MGTKVEFDAANIPDEFPLPPMGANVVLELVGVVAEGEDGDTLRSKTGKEMIRLNFAVVADGEEYDRYKLSQWLVEPATNLKTKINVKKIGKAFGLSDADMSTGLDFADLIGKTGSAVLKKDTWEGRETRKIRDFVTA